MFLFLGMRQGRDLSVLPRFQAHSLARFDETPQMEANLETLTVRSIGNPDLGFQNLNLDLPIEREIRKRISPPRNPSSGWISIKKSKSGFFGFPFLSFDKDLQNRSREQRSSFY